jgi:hypothetical protein
MAANTTPYSTYALQSHAEEIRLLQLQPGRWADPISCTFKIISLNDPHPKYDALSYVWGPQGNRWEISLEGQCTLVTNNLFKALRRLRRAKDVRTIWVDALCINQTDPNEKAAQVAIMSKIYKRTSTTWIWLNDYQTVPPTPRDIQTVEETNDLIWYGQELSDAGIDGGYGAFAVVLDFACSHKRHLNEIPLFTTEETPGGAKLKIARESVLHAFQAFTEVVNVDWWRRVWVIQEAVLPSLAMMLLGSIHMPWEAFAMAATYLRMHTKCCQNWLSSAPELANVFERFTISVMEIGWTRQSRQVDDSLSYYSLHHLLWQYRCHSATDSRDKVYALLSFLADGEANGELAPDYTLSRKEVYKRAVMYDVRTTKKLNILQGQRGQMPASSGLPSWIYDWSAPVDGKEWLNERQRLRNDDYKASGDEPVSISCDSNYVLSLDGILVDTVCTVGPQGSNSRAMIVAISVWLQMAGLPGQDRELYVGGGDRSTAFWRTVTRDYTFNENMDPQRISNADEHIVAASKWWNSVVDHNQSATTLEKKFEFLVAGTAAGQQFFLTTKGYMGMGNPQIGDRVFVLMGGDVPFVLRPGEKDEAYFFVIGDCYVHGIMDGEVLGRKRQPVILH